MLGTAAQGGHRPAGRGRQPSPEIFPITHIVDHATIVVHTAVGTKLEGSLGRDVAFEVDGYDPDTGEAWSVIVKGLAREIKQMYEALEALDLPLFP